MNLLSKVTRMFGQDSGQYRGTVGWSRIQSLRWFVICVASPLTTQDHSLDVLLDLGLLPRCSESRNGCLPHLLTSDNTRQHPFLDRRNLNSYSCCGYAYWIALTHPMSWFRRHGSSELKIATDEQWLRGMLTHVPDLPTTTPFVALSKFNGVLL